MLSAKQIAPGHTGEIQVTVKTEGLSGPLSKSVTVFSNDPRTPVVVIALSATIQPEFELKERSVFFGSAPKGKELSKDLIITIAAEKDLKLTGAESSDADIVARLEPVPDSNGKKIKLVVTMKPEAKEGYHRGTVVVKTSSLRNPELKIMVLAVVSASRD